MTQSQLISKAFKKKYISFTGFILLFIIFIGIAFTFFLNSEDDFAKIINISGRQRMLSQRIAFHSSLVFNESGDLALNKSILQAAINDMRAAHEKLVTGDEEQNISQEKNEELFDLYFKEPQSLDHRVKNYLATAELFLDNEASVEDMAFVTNASQDKLLFYLNKAVNLYEEQAHKDQASVINFVSINLVLFTILIILGTIFFFRPTEKVLEKFELDNREYIDQILDTTNDFERLVFITAHHLQEPIRQLLMYLSLVKKDFGNDLPTKASEKFKIIDASALKMRALVHDVHHYLSIETGNFENETVDLNQLFERLIRQKKEKYKNTEIDFSGHLPSLYIEAQLLEILFDELIENACKFSRNEENPVVNINLEEDTDKHILISVRDNGVGIPNIEKEDIVFQPLKKLHSDEEFPGNGMGLALVSKIIKRWKAYIEYDSKKQTCFFVTIPKHIQGRTKDYGSVRL